MRIISFFIFTFSFFLITTGGGKIKVNANNEEIIKIKGDVENGIELFKKNCTACHSIELEKKMIGPALHGVTKKRSRKWLHQWIKNNKSLRDSGDQEAISIYKEYGNIEMNSFPQLSDNQIDDILSFIKNPDSIKKKENHEYEINKNEEKEENKFLIKFIVFCFIILSLILFWILYRIQILIRLINENEEEKILVKENFIINFLYKKILGNDKKKWYLFSCFTGIFLLLGTYETWNFLMKIDVNKGYKPEQPIYFSHKIHSEINKIDCQYCHSSAKYGKVSGIPSVNVCMNCHITIHEYNGDYLEKGKSRDEYNREIQKIYKAVGWNPETRKYSNKTYPIQWIRIHNMPDFVYFDHSQHIITGEQKIKKLKKVNLVCNACHGEVQKMDTVEMSNDFTMEWCLSCHRQVEIDSNNPYYKEYFPNNTNNKNKITVDMVGGTECAKCHY
ncbi:c-type cytochrome [Blattabacterium sp. (Blaberus giganteus)]|uniref:c-type cytochrome n=1 Tax=Blattabacterium sp. (Blaberus giganteus) TaxID=1186051 RepID=UPI00025F6E31|nr:c-type cytochrome [Blattabacterium sp. (Blaberus giganteus)]AFJ90515.1 cytochrome c [Blattabacterium sp. (Blaberus giganteus)]